MRTTRWGKTGEGVNTAVGREASLFTKTPLQLFVYCPVLVLVDILIKEKGVLGPVTCGKVKGIHFRAAMMTLIA